MIARRRTLRQRSRRAVILLWSVAAVLLALSAALIAFTISQQLRFYQAQTVQAQTLENATSVRPSFWLQLSWQLQSLPPWLLMVGLACAVAPVFVFAITAQRRVAAEGAADAERSTG